MKKLLYIVLALLPMAAMAQTHSLRENSTLSSTQVELRQISSFGYKLPKGFDIGLEEELREIVYAPDAEIGFSKSYTTLNVGYKLLSQQSLNTGYKYSLKLDLGYTLKYDVLDYDSARADGVTGRKLASECLQHRPYAALTGSVDLGNWKISLKETYRITFRTDSVQVTDKWNPEITVNEKNPALMELKSRLKVDYSIPGKPIKLFAFGEASTTLNEQTCPWNDTEGKPLYGGQYLRSAKASLGVRWKINSHNSLSLSYLYYYKQNRDINISRKAQDVDLVIEKTHTHAIVLAYDLGY